MFSYLENHIIGLWTASNKILEEKSFGKPSKNDDLSNFSTFELILSDEVSG